MYAVPRLGSGIPLVARTAELTALRAALSRAESGTASAVLLSGEAGVGKTRVLTELIGAAGERDVLTLSGRCLDMAEGGLPYLPFADALGELTASRDEHVLAAVRERPSLGILLPQLAAARPSAEHAVVGAPDRDVSRGARVEQDVGQLRLFDAVLGLLGALAQRRVVLLVLEDLHWADSSTRALLSFLLSRLRTQRLLVVASYREDDVHRRHPLRPLLAELVRLDAVARVELAPLSDPDARTLVRTLADEALDGDLVARLAERSEGNPFFVEELLACPGDADLPTGLAEILLARVEGLPAGTKAVVRAAAVADGPTGHTALAEVTELAGTDLDEALRVAVQHHILVIDDRFYSFRHALLREAVYGDLMPGERARLHAAYAGRLRGREAKRGTAALLAYHSVESNDLPTALAASVRAAEESGEWGGAPAAALRHIERALRIWDSVPAQQRPPGVDQVDLLHRASDFAATAAQPERAISYARAAVEALEPDPVGIEAVERAAQKWRRLSKTLLFQDDTEQEAAEAIERAWQLVADLEPSACRARVLATRADVLRATASRDEAVWSAQSAIADAKAVGASGAEIDALISLAVLVEMRGEVQEARDRLREAVRKAEQAEAHNEELRARHMLGVSFEDQGELTAALEACREGMDRAARTGLTWSLFGTELRGRELLLRYWAGEWTDVPELTVSGQGGSSAVAARMAMGPAQISVAQGRFDDAERMLAGMRAHWHTEVRLVIASGCAGGELAIWCGDYESAIERVQEALDLHAGLVEFGLGAVRLAAVGIEAGVANAAAARLRNDVAAETDALARGEAMLTHARECVARGRPRNGTLGPEGRAWVARVEAAAGGLRGPANPRLWADTVDAFDYGATYEQAVSRWKHAEALLATGTKPDAELAGEQLCAAHEVALRLDALPLRDAVRALARRATIELPGVSTEAGRDVLNPLTDRELAVLELVALGKTNREVGAQLYISEKTVSVHLSRVMAKLGAGRRAEAVALAYDRGLLTQPNTTAAG